MNNFEILRAGFEAQDGVGNTLLGHAYSLSDASDFMHEEYYEDETLHGFLAIIPTISDEDISQENKNILTMFYNGLIGTKMLEHYGGEGQGEDYWTVCVFPSLDNLHVKFDGWYASHNGAEYQDMKQVTPSEKTITVYE